MSKFPERENNFGAVRTWLRTTHTLNTHLGQRGVGLADAFLVGSQLRRADCRADIDSVIVIEDDCPLATLRSLRAELQEHVALSEAAQYHFKLFSRRSLMEAAAVDGYRVRSFQLGYLSLRGTPLLHQLQPRLNLSTLAISLRIQALYSYFRYIDSPRRLRQLMRRLSRSLRIDYNVHPLLPRPTLDALPCLASLDDGLAKVLGLVTCSHVDHAAVRVLLKEHLMTVSHEFVNKGDAYESALERITPSCVVLSCRP